MAGRAQGYGEADGGACGSGGAKAGQAKGKETAPGYFFFPKLCGHERIPKIFLGLPL